jgi:signal transduction histidine kinase
MIDRLYTAFAILLFAASSIPSANAQALSGAAGRLIHESWTFKDGAPEVTAALAQTEDGYLWIGAPAGLFRFDGVRFELFQPAGSERLLSTNVSALQAADGALWVGYVFGGFSFVKNGRVKNFDEVTGTVNGFASDANGVVWAAVRGKRGDVALWRYDGASWQRLGADSGLPAKPKAQVGVDRDVVVWVLAGGRGPEIPKDLYFLRAGERRFQKAASGFLTGGLVFDAQHRVLTATEARDALLANPSVAWESGLPAYPILTQRHEAFVDRANGLWVTDRDALTMPIAPGQSVAQAIAAISAANADVHDVKAMLEARIVDREGSIWIGGEEALHRLSYSPLLAQALPASPSPWFMVAPDDGGVWINASDGASHSALYRVTNGKLTAQSLPGGVNGFAFRAADKTLWLGGEDGVWQVEGGVPRRVELPPETTNFLRFLFAATQDASGAMWLSFAGGGLYRQQGGKWTKHQPTTGGRACPQSGVMIMFTDPRERLWLGCPRNQMAVIEDGHERAYEQQDGLEVGNVSALYARGDKLWIGGEFGLQRFEDGRFRAFHALDDEALRGISGIVETASGDLWLNGLGGIVHIRQSEIAAAEKDPSYRVNSERYDRRAGLPGLPSQIGHMPTAIEGGDGRLWFSVNNGVVSVDPSSASVTPPAPPVSIQSIVADDKVYELGSAATFAPNTSSVQVTYAAVSLLHPDAIRFRYRLRGTDDEWHDAGRTTSVSYRSLSPGGYRFEVGATDANGIWSKDVATVDFTMLPAFYQTSWFRVLCGLLLLMLVWAGYRLRIRSLHRQFEMTLDARVGERTRIARDLHDTLLQSFHGLLLRFQTARALLPTNPAKAAEVLDSAIDQTAAAITEGRDAVQGLRASATEMNDLAESIRALGEALAAESESHGVLRLDVQGAPRLLHPIVRDEVFRIIGEALRNAFRHAQAEVVEVEIRYDERQLRVRVRDDGKGIDPSVVQAEGREGHFGLQGMRERAKQVGGKLTVWTGKDAGTEVELAIPALRAYGRPSGESPLGSITLSESEVGGS